MTKEVHKLKRPKIRKTWQIKPVTKIHSLKGYRRAKQKQVLLKEN